MLLSKKFIPLFITQFLGAFNDNLLKNSLIVLVTYSLAQKIGLELEPTLSKIGIIFICPYIFFSDIAGRLADRYNKVALVIYIKIAEILIMALGAYGYFIESLNLLYFTLFLMGTQSTFFSPIKYSLLPDHLPKEKLILANGVISLGTFIAVLTGTLIGTVSILTDNGIELVSTLILVIAAMGLISGLFIPSTPAKDKTSKILKLNFLSVISYLVKDKRILKTSLLITWFWYLGALILTILPVYAKEVLNVKEDILVLLFGIFVLGIGSGSIFVNLILKNKISKLTLIPSQIGILISTIALFLIDFPSVQEVLGIGDPRFAKHGSKTKLYSNDFLGLKESYYICLSFFFITFFSGLYIVPLNAMLQNLTIPATRAKVIAASGLINAIMMVIASISIITLSKLGLNSIEILLANSALCLPLIFYIRKL